MPIGKNTSLAPEIAAQICHRYLKSCRVLIPMLFTSTSETESESARSSSNSGLKVEPAASHSIVARLEQELAGLNDTQISVVDSEDALLGKWVFF